MKEQLFERTYIVGGSIRDHFLNLDSKDTDYVVVNSSIEEMKSYGFKQVGSDFPVFLHPETNEEYALARTERKLNNDVTSYLNFETEIENVTIESDLLRRDLTINSIAYSLSEKKYIDPYGGLDDIKNRILKHTSEAFAEDPVRVLRLARFASRYGIKDYPFAHGNGPDNGFIIDQSTLDLCSQINCTALQTDRVREEFKKAMREPYPSHFFRALHSMEQLKSIFPMIHRLIGTIENPKHHAEGSSQDTRTGIIPNSEYPKMGTTFEHTMLVLDNMSILCKVETQLSDLNDIDMLAAITHDLGKAKSPLYKSDGNPMAIEGKHHGHENRLNLINEFCEQYGYGKSTINLLRKVMKNHMKIHGIPKTNGANQDSTNKQRNILKPVKTVRMLEEFNTPDEFMTMVKLACADNRGRLGHANSQISQFFDLYNQFLKIKKISISDIISEEELNDLLSKKQYERIQRKLEVARTNLLQKMRNDNDEY